MSRPGRAPATPTTIVVAALVVVVVTALTAVVVVNMTHPGPPPPSQAGAFAATVDLPPIEAATADSSGQPPAGWTIARSDASGAPLVATALVHPDAGEQSSFVGAAWMSPSALRFTLVPGTQQPGGLWSARGEVPPELRPSLVAVFNSGFKYKDITGGFEAEGRVARPLVDGQASVVIDANGTPTVGQWGRDVGPSADIVAVRQNMPLIVDGGQTVPDLLSRHDRSWGKERWQTQHTDRSGLGQLADGSLVYVAGPDMDLQGLADALVAVHAVRGMELDIHANMETFHIFDPGDGTRPGASRELLDLMTAGPDRYLVPGKRDFLAVTLR